MAKKRSDPTCEEIRKALKDYNAEEGAFDGPLFDRVGARIRQQGYLGPDDLFLIVAWKSVPQGALVNARGAVESNTPAEIEQTTREALREVVPDSDVDAAVEAVRTLARLKYVKVPIASAILAFFDPKRFGASTRMLGTPWAGATMKSIGNRRTMVGISDGFAKSPSDAASRLVKSMPHCTR